MKVLSFSYCFPNPVRPQWGVFVLQRLAALGRRPDVDLEVVAPVPTFPGVSGLRAELPPAEDVRDGLTVHHPRFFYLPKVLKSLDGRWYARGLTSWVGDLCRRGRPDVLDAHFEWPDGAGVGRIARALGIPYTITLRGWLYEAMGRPPILRQCVEAMRRAAAIISVSSHLADTAAGLGIPRAKIHVIPNGVDTTRFVPRDKGETRRELGLPTDGRLLATVAHLGPRKGHRETIHALARLPRDVRLVLVGGDSQGGGTNERALRHLADRLKLDGRVILVGQQPYERVPLYLAAADASVLASYREGCPNVVLESLASGTPVVASDVGGVSDMIEDGRNGRIVPPQQIDPLATAIGQLLDRPPSPGDVCRSSAVRTWDEVAADAGEVLRRAARSAQPTCGLTEPVEGAAATT